MSSPTFLIISIILAIGATVAAAILILPESRAKNMNKIMYFLHNLVNFRTLLIDKILKILYIFFTCSVVISGFFTLFYVEERYNYWSGETSKTWYGWIGLLMMVLGPIAVRIVYEFIMMTVLLVSNVASINGKLADKEKNNNDSFTAPKQPAPQQNAYQPYGYQQAVPQQNAYQAPAYQQTAPQQPAPQQNAYQQPAAQKQAEYRQPAAPASNTVFCGHCGERYNPAMGVCPRCGNINE